ncbi:MAG: HypC/HybG/HupF family hydrogenase formation chaperone, partial [Parasporobacterium sp.]|nr:HypC/HybG/HupF family hydrogenase formation chaperone [Parasporobacterium sp.]
MCVAIPLKITEISGSDGIGERDGVKRKVRLDFIKDPKPGEYVIVHAGFAIERISEEDALETLS